MIKKYYLHRLKYIFTTLLIINKIKCDVLIHFGKIPTRPNILSCAQVHCVVIEYTISLNHNVINYHLQWEQTDS